MKRLPQEIEVWYIIPAIRCEIAKAMIKKGIKQRNVARVIGMTDAAISQYMSGKRANKIVFNEKIKKEIDKSVEKIIKDNTKLNSEINKICLYLRKTKFLCRVHNKFDKIPKGCRICIKEEKI